MRKQQIEESHVSFDFGGNTFIADVNSHLYWPKKNAIILSDVHLGKIFHFRKNGIPIPTDMMAEPYKKLDLAIEKYQPETVYILGDLFHSNHNPEWEYLHSYVESYDKIQFVLRAGNHDTSTLKNAYESGMKVMEEDIQVGNMIMTHHPPEEIKESEFYYLSGHVHPAVSMRSGPRQSVRLPCFYFSDNIGILPAFGNFTGTYKLKPKRNDRVIAILGTKLVCYLEKNITDI